MYHVVIGSYKTVPSGVIVGASVRFNSASTSIRI